MPTWPVETDDGRRKKQAEEAAWHGGREGGREQGRHGGSVEGGGGVWHVLF